MLGPRAVRKIGSVMWDVLKSPRTVALLKLGAATVAMIHAVDEFVNASGSGKRRIGFQSDE